MKRHKGIMDHILVHTDLLCEPVPGVPLLELMNDHRVLIENHCGVTAYGPAEIRIRVKYGEISVCGSKLEMACMTGKQLVIIGNIHSINIMRGTCK